MGKVLTINRKMNFSVEMEDTEKTITRITMNGLKEDVETKIYPRGKALLEYYKFIVEFYKKYNIVGRVNNTDFNSVLRKYTIPLYVKEDSDYVISIGGSKGNVTRAALRRLKKGTSVKCSPVKIDLTKAIGCIIRNIQGIEVVSGWFSNLGEQLQNALLQGKEVNENVDWKKFLKTVGSELKNVEFKLAGDEYVKGYVIFSLSSRGFFYIKSAISDEKYIKIAEKIVGVLERENLIEYENVKEDNEPDEENIYVDL